MKLPANIIDWNQSDEGLYVPPAASSIALNFQVAGTTDNVLRSGATTNVQLAAEWTQSEASSIKYVYLQIKRAGTIASGKIVQARIVKNNSGAPGSLTYGLSDRIECADIATSYAWVKFTFPEPVSVEEATTYHIVLEGDYDVSGTNNIVWRSKTVTSGGNLEKYGTGWVSTTTENFEVYASIPTIFQSGYNQFDAAGVQVQGNQPSALCRTADVSDATKSATITIDSVAWKITNWQPDGNGLTLFELSRDAEGE